MWLNCHSPTVAPRRYSLPPVVHEKSLSVNVRCTGAAFFGIFLFSLEALWRVAVYCMPRFTLKGRAVEAELGLLGLPFGLGFLNCWAMRNPVNISLAVDKSERFDPPLAALEVVTVVDPNKTLRAKKTACFQKFFLYSFITFP